jgi:hypothetical protein
VPFLSHRVAEIALGLTLQFWTQPWNGDKRALRTMARSRLHATNHRRKKQPFFLPTETAYGGKLERLFDEVVDRSSLGAQGLFRPDKVAELRRDAGTSFLTHKKLVAILHLQLWWRSFLG